MFLNVTTGFLKPLGYSKNKKKSNHYCHFGLKPYELSHDWGDRGDAIKTGWEDDTSRKKKSEWEKKKNTVIIQYSEHNIFPWSCFIV